MRPHLDPSATGRQAQSGMTAALVLMVIGCAGGSRGSAEPPAPSGTGSAEAAPATSSAPAASAETAPERSVQPVGSKLFRDVDASPKQFKIAPNDGHGLGNFSLAVDGRVVWPPRGKGCAELVRCCSALVAASKELALACLLATGRDPNCNVARRTSSEIALEHGVSLPSSCAR
jgi:hypothetical protein